MRVLVTGADGQLGHDVCREIGKEAIGIDISELDITDRQMTLAYIDKLCPDAIIHCAAYTAVDMAEAKPDRCHSVNVLGTRWLAEAAKGIDAKFIYMSTDYVFDGALDRPYETDDAPNPLSVYGRTKLEGEDTVRNILEKYFIVRASWIFGLAGNNFVKTILRLGREHGVVRVVADQYGSPTYAPDLAKLLAAMIHSEKYGVFHASNEGFCSWYDFARFVFEVSGLDAKVDPISATEYPAAAVRPGNSRLSKKSLADAGFAFLPTWQDAAAHFCCCSGATAKCGSACVNARVLR